MQTGGPRNLQSSNQQEVSMGERVKHQNLRDHCLICFGGFWGWTSIYPLQYFGVSMRADACWSGTSSLGTPPFQLPRFPRTCAHAARSQWQWIRCEGECDADIHRSKGRASNIKNPTRAKIPCRIVSKVFFLFCQKCLDVFGVLLLAGANGTLPFPIMELQELRGCNHYVRTAWVGCILGTGKTPPVHQLGKVGLPWSTSDGGTHWGWDTNFIHHFTISYRFMLAYLIKFRME